MLTSAVRAAAAITGTTFTARRSTTVLAHLAGFGADLVGPPDTLTHLRPVQYAARFVAPQPVSSTKKLHPYSLQEFSSVSRSSTSEVVTQSPFGKRDIASLNRLERLRQKFEAEDLAWRLQRRRLDQISNEHWARSNAAFSASKRAAEEAAEERVALTTFPKGNLNYDGGQKYDAEVMEQFHRSWVEERADEYERYQQQWIAGIVSHLRPAIRAVYREWRWKFELWRCGLL